MCKKAPGAARRFWLYPVTAVLLPRRHSNSLFVRWFCFKIFKYKHFDIVSRHYIGRDTGDGNYVKFIGVLAAGNNDRNTLVLCAHRQKQQSAYGHHRQCPMRLPTTKRGRPEEAAAFVALAVKAHEQKPTQQLSVIP